MSEGESQGAKSPERSRSLPSDDDDQILERLSWSPAQRLRYLLDMLEFEERAHKARPIPKGK
jgi:hypothetical protein